MGHAEFGVELPSVARYQCRDESLAQSIAWLVTDTPAARPKRFVASSITAAFPPKPDRGPSRPVDLSNGCLDGCFQPVEISIKRPFSTGPLSKGPLYCSTSCCLAFVPPPSQSPSHVSTTTTRPRPCTAPLIGESLAVRTGRGRHPATARQPTTAAHVRIRPDIWVTTDASHWLKNTHNK